MLYTRSRSGRRKQNSIPLICAEGPHPLLLEDDVDKPPLSSTNGRDWEPRDHLFITRILPESMTADLRAMTTNSQ